ncbi:hypothetical protein [Phytopseudomonas dryadis]|uniref:Uncharacterized protein n=1 Tax=Phytopseudomonas dryadis TaxID=2487520 RepID=A0A4Q9R3W4_9GAMM|nr:MULTISPECIES: hypothetical protein [Pseudomonas]TBU93441.1 hypothetical protein DNK44_10680 [Pseudomonas dryadis]TBV07050.1 hypothetical protein DNK34_09505 [Pseudomonas dryadis]TBV19556.1 hypothetical protein DNK41_03210 [Pseudomonas sp. FRB 230]
MYKAMLVTLCLALAACGAGEPGHLSLELDGKAMRFDSRLLAQLSDSREHLVVGGRLPGSAMSDSYDFELWALGGEIKPGTYSLSDSQLISRYAVQHEQGTEVWSALGHTDGASFELKIDAIDDWGVRGSFHGRIKRLGGEGFIDVSDGSFAAPFTLQNP